MTFVVVGALAILAGGCGERYHGRRTVRLIEGKPQHSRYVSPSAYRHYLEARLLLARGDGRGAVEQLRAALLFDERSPLLYTELARLLARQGEGAAGRKALARALALGPDYPDALLLAGHLAERAGEPARALARYRRCAAVDTSFLPCPLRIAALQRRRGEIRAARRGLEALAKRHPKNPGVQRRLGALCLGQVDLSCAKDAFRAALAAKTTIPTLLRLAMTARGRGELQQATTHLREVFDRSGGDLRAAEALLEVLLQRKAKVPIDDLLAVLQTQAQRRPEQLPGLAELLLTARRHKTLLTLVAKLKPARRSPTLKILAALARARSGSPARARAELSALLPSPQGPRAALALGRLYLRTGRAQRAARVLASSARRHPRNTSLLSLLSRAQAEAGDEEGSLTPWARALSNHPKPQTRLAYAAALARAGRWRRALAQAQKVARGRSAAKLDSSGAKAQKDTQVPPSPALVAAAKNFIGFTLADRDAELPRAARLLATAAQLDPGRAYIIDSLGWLSFRRGNLAEARRLLSVAHRLAPREAEIAAHLAAVNAALRRLPDAIRLYRRAIALALSPHESAPWRKKLKQLTLRRVGNHGSAAPAPQ